MKLVVDSSRFSGQARARPSRQGWVPGHRLVQPTARNAGASLQQQQRSAGAAHEQCSDAQ